MAECPRCDAVLARGASACACGWKARVRREPDELAPLPHVQCAHETCGLSAISKVKTPTGWARFCPPHYLRYFDDLAHEGLAAKGLERLPDETRSEHTARLRAWFKENARLKRFPDLDAEAA